MTRRSAGIPATSLGGVTRNGMPGGGGYRWRGLPGWNPAAQLATEPDRRTRRYTPETLARRCTFCEAPAGVQCKGPTGKRLSKPHYDRFAAEES